MMQGKIDRILGVICITMLTLQIRNPLNRDHLVEVCTPEVRLCYDCSLYDIVLWNKELVNSLGLSFNKSTDYRDGFVVCVLSGLTDTIGMIVSLPSSAHSNPCTQDQHIHL